MARPAATPRRVRRPCPAITADAAIVPATRDDNGRVVPKRAANQTPPHPRPANGGGWDAGPTSALWPPSVSIWITSMFSIPVYCCSQGASGVALPASSVGRPPLDEIGEPSPVVKDCDPAVWLLLPQDAEDRGELAVAVLAHRFELHHVPQVSVRRDTVQFGRGASDDRLPVGAAQRRHYTTRREGPGP